MLADSLIDYYINYDFIQAIISLTLFIFGELMCDVANKHE